MTPLDDPDRLPEDFRGYARKRPYAPVFATPARDWRVEANWDDAYYEAARAIILGVAEGRYSQAVEGVAGLYLFRHYLELALKYIVLHSRWLKDEQTLAPPDEIKEVVKSHDLETLWRIVETESLPKIPEARRQEWDIEFVASCIHEFQSVDTKQGERFRYHGARFGGPSLHARIERLGVDFMQLAENMAHVREVLGIVDTWLFETHGMIQDYISDLAEDAQ